MSPQVVTVTDYLARDGLRASSADRPLLVVSTALTELGQRALITRSLLIAPATGSGLRV